MLCFALWGSIRKRKTKEQGTSPILGRDVACNEIAIEGINERLRLTYYCNLEEALTGGTEEAAGRARCGYLLRNRLERSPFELARHREESKLAGRRGRQLPLAEPCGSRFLFRTRR